MIFSGPSIQIPEAREPIINPLADFASALRDGGVSVMPLLRVETGAKLGHPGSHQFAFTSSDDFSGVAAKIADLGKVVRFIEMMVPKSGVVCAQTYQFHNIWARYIAFYEPKIDETYGRWDVLVEPLR